MKHDNSQLEILADHVDRAKLALAGNLLDPALEEVRAALRLDPDHAEARLLEARIRLRRHEPRLALTALDNEAHAKTQPLTVTQDGPEATLLRATALSAAGKVELAIALMETLAEEFADDAGVLRTLAGMQVHDQRADDAIDTLQKLITLDPADSGTRRVFSDLLAERDPDAAFDALGPINPTNLRRAARLCLKCERLAEAEKHYGVLLATLDAEDALDAGARFEAARVAELRGENSRAIDRLSVVAQSEKATTPEAAAAWRRIGRLHLGAGRIGESGRAFHRATRDTVNSAEGWAGLVLCAERTGRKRLLTKADGKLRAVADRSERRRLLAALTPHAVGAPGQEVPEAAAHSPLQRMLAEASAVMSKTAAKFPGRADVHYHRAVCNAARGEFADAGDALDQALEINPRYAAAQAMADRLNTDGAEWENLAEAA